MAASFSITQLTLSFLPLVLLVVIFVRWHLNWRELLWALFRMVSQLIAVGYILTFIFKSSHWFWPVLCISIMLVFASWIALRSIKEIRLKTYRLAFLSLFFGATPILAWSYFLVIPGTLELAVFIPLAGMVYANAMNSMSIAAERLVSDLKQNVEFDQAKTAALRASLIREINTLFAVGLVSFPGILTGQILSGVDPLIAVRYQVVVITLILAVDGFSSTLFITLYSRQHHSSTLIE